MVTSIFFASFINVDFRCDLNYFYQKNLLAESHDRDQDRNRHFTPEGSIRPPALSINYIIPSKLFINIFGRSRLI